MHLFLSSLFSVVYIVYFKLLSILTCLCICLVIGWIFLCCLGILRCAVCSYLYKRNYNFLLYCNWCQEFCLYSVWHVFMHYFGSFWFNHCVSIHYRIVGNCGVRWILNLCWGVSYVIEVFYGNGCVRWIMMLYWGAVVCLLLVRAVHTKLFFYLS